MLKVSQTTVYQWLYADDLLEIFAAERAEMKVVTVDRPGNAPISARDRAAAPLVTSLTDIVLKMQ